MAFVIMFFGVLVVVTLIWGALVVALRLIVRVALAGSAALLGGIILGALISGGSDNQVPLTFLSAVALFAPACVLLSMRCEPAASRILTQPRAAESIRPKTPAPQQSRRFRLLGWRRPIDANERLRTSIEALTQVADWAEARVNVIRRTLLASESALAARTLDPDAMDRLIILQKRVPELISRCLSRVEDASPRQHVTRVDDLLSLLEDVAADCERMRADGIGDHDFKYEALRRRIEDSLRRRSSASAFM